MVRSTNPPSNIMQPTSRSHNRLVVIFLLIITVLGVVVVASDWQDMSQVLTQADWRYLPLVLLFTFFSYTSYSYAYAFVCDLLDIGMHKRDLAVVCFISGVVNHVLSTAGVAGYSLRYLLMKMYNVSLKDVLTSSILHTYITSLDMLTFLPLTFIYLLVRASVPRGIAIAFGLVTLLFALVLILTTVLVVFPSRRFPIIKVMASLGQKILHRDYLPWLTQLDETLTCGTLAIRQRPMLLVWIMFLTLVDFACSIAAMGFVFEALGPGVPPTTLVTGYVIGIMAGLASMVPGGFGVQEGSMAGIYALLGVHLEQAVLAAILFRILYYLVPYFLILPFSNRLLRRAKQQAAMEV
jgi:uncharacterized protein (TIRG00374 family)